MSLMGTAEQLERMYRYLSQSSIFLTYDVKHKFAKTSDILKWSYVHGRHGNNRNNTEWLFYCNQRPI